MYLFARGIQHHHGGDGTQEHTKGKHIDHVEVYYIYVGWAPQNTVLGLIT